MWSVECNSYYNINLIFWLSFKKQLIKLRGRVVGGGAYILNGWWLNVMAFHSARFRSLIRDNFFDKCVAVSRCAEGVYAYTLLALVSTVFANKNVSVSTRIKFDCIHFFYVEYRKIIGIELRTHFQFCAHSKNRLKSHAFVKILNHKFQLICPWNASSQKKHTARAKTRCCWPGSVFSSSHGRK